MLLSYKPAKLFSSEAYWI